ncbi:MAG TPA: DUF58 domain-containing protein [Kiloniellales bacterium]|nr:DUF58 domain-containing protein [Kiloniellales bacterium]
MTMVPVRQASGSSARLQQRAEALAAGLPPLLAAAERVAATVVQGVHGRRRIGLGETFWQFRPYEPGDRPQLIDWRQTAKSDRVFVRDLEWEAAQSLWLWRDASGSMSWQSVEARDSKRSRAELLALALAALLLRGGERVTFLGSGLNPGSGRQALLRMALTLQREVAETEDLPSEELLPRHGRLVLFSDFLASLDDISARLRYYAARGIGGHLVQILDPAELSFPFSGRLNFEGLEAEKPWLVSRSEAVRRSYRQRLERQQLGLAELARRLSWSYSFHRTDRSPESALLQLYQIVADAPSTGGRR